jgi:hypothetical protein
MHNNYRYSAEWEFTNGHQWIKYFETEDDMHVFILTCGLESHPDITKVIRHKIKGD